MLFITFLSSVCFSIVLPSIWPFLHNEVKDLTAVFKSPLVRCRQVHGGLGCCSEQLGFLCSLSPLWSMVRQEDNQRSSIGITGDYGHRKRDVFAINQRVDAPGRKIHRRYSSRCTTISLLLIQSSANYAVAQTYLSYATTTTNRTMVMALNSACTVLGFVVGPGHLSKKLNPDYCSLCSGPELRPIYVLWSQSQQLYISRLFISHFEYLEYVLHDCTERNSCILQKEKANPFSFK